MYYFWIPIVILFLVAIFSDTNTWSPFQSEQVKNICMHMTKTERRAAIKRNAMWGLFIGLVPGAIGFILGLIIFKSALLGMTLCYLLFPLVAIVLWKKWIPNIKKSQKSFLASTEWAKSQSINADDIHLYNWQKQKWSYRSEQLKAFKGVCLHHQVVLLSSTVLHSRVLIKGQRQVYEWATSQ